MEMPAVVTIPLIIAITIAVVNRIKAEVPQGIIKSGYYTLISMAIGAALYAIAIYANPIVFTFITVGLGASGVFDIYSKTVTTIK